MNSILWETKAIKRLNKIQYQDRLIIKDAVSSLADLSTAKNIKKLINHSYDYRLRVGRYRVLFDHDIEIKII